MVGAKYKNRNCVLYFPSEQDLKRWQGLSNKAGIPLSRWIYETVELHLETEGTQPTGELANEISQLREKNNRLLEELKLKSLMLEKYETELFKLRHEAFNELEYQGGRSYSKDLISVLKQGGVWSGTEILRSLQIDPCNSDAANIVSRQLQNLQDYGLVREEMRGWCWIC